MGERKSVLVTGASGFIGRATVIALEKAGWDVTRTHRFREVSDDPKELYLDLTKPGEILSMATEVHFDAIVHIGSQIGWTGESLGRLYVPNVMSTGCLAVLSKYWDAHLLFASAAIVSGMRTQRIEATSPSFPDSPYAKSKWLAEELILASECSHCIFRIAGVFGLHGPKHLGINRAIDGAINGQAPTQFGRAEALRNYIYVKDVADSIVFALESKLQGTHLVSGSELLSIQEMLSQICKVFIPDQKVQIKDGKEACSQVICPSQHLPAARKFIDALSDIKGLIK